MNIYKDEEIKIVTDEAVLRQVSRVTTFKEALSKNLFDRLQAATEKAWTSGVGLAAIQIGVPLRFAYYKRALDTPTFLINPIILHGAHLVPHNGEGCLSMPDQRVRTWRYNEISYEKLVNGKMQLFKATGFEAFIIQHEVDHMNGILCCDRQDKPVTPGRNDLCPCGSMKKFKKCCESKGVMI